MSPDQEHVTSPRLNYYNPKLDPYMLDNKMTPAMVKAVIEGTYDDGSVEQSGPLLEPDSGHPYNLISSLCEDGLHRPAIDYDHPCDGPVALRLWQTIYPSGSVVLVRSTSNWHVYVPTRTYTTDDYFTELEDLAELGLVEPGYLEASRARGQTLLRPPHITKPVVTA